MGRWCKPNPTQDNPSAKKAGRKVRLFLFHGAVRRPISIRVQLRPTACVSLAAEKFDTISLEQLQRFLFRSQMDIVAPAKRSEMMSRIKGRDTGPELRVRRCAHALGFRFRLHSKHLPGRPDLVFPRLKTVIFVHGCFWHRHKGCPHTSTPKTRVGFWQEKFQANIDRDIRVAASLRLLGWRVLTIWECQSKDTAKLMRRLHRMLAE